MNRWSAGNQCLQFLETNEKGGRRINTRKKCYKFNFFFLQRWRWSGDNVSPRTSLYSSMSALMLLVVMMATLMPGTTGLKVVPMRRTCIASCPVDVRRTPITDDDDKQQTRTRRDARVSSE